MEDMIIAMATAIILEAVKNPQKKAALKRAMLKMWKSIGNMYAGDPDFTQNP